MRVSLQRAADGEIEAVKHPQDGAGVITSLTETDGLLEFADDVTDDRARRPRRFSVLCGADGLIFVHPPASGAMRVSSASVAAKRSGGTSPRTPSGPSDDAPVPRPQRTISALDAFAQLLKGRNHTPFFPGPRPIKAPHGFAE